MTTLSEKLKYWKQHIENRWTSDNISISLLILFAYAILILISNQFLLNPTNTIREHHAYFIDLGLAFTTFLIFNRSFQKYLFATVIGFVATSIYQHGSNELLLAILSAGTKIILLLGLTHIYYKIFPLCNYSIVITRFRMAFRLVGTLAVFSLVLGISEFFICGLLDYQQLTDYQYISYFSKEFFSKFSANLLLVPLGFSLCNKEFLSIFKSQSISYYTEFLILLFFTLTNTFLLGNSFIHVDLIGLGLIVWASYRFSHQGGYSIGFIASILECALFVKEQSFINVNSMQSLNFNIDILVWLLCTINVMTTVFIATSENRRQKSERLLQEKKAQYKIMTSTMRDIISRHKKDSSITYISAGCKAILGYSPQELLNTNYFNLCHVNDREKLKKLFTESHIDGCCSEGIHHSSSLMLTYRVLNKKGQYIWLESSIDFIDCIRQKVESSKEFDNLAHLDEFVLVSRDVTERMLVDEQLKKLTLDLEIQKFAMDQHAIVSITDADGFITYVNTKFCEVCQYDSNQLIGETHKFLNSGVHSPEIFTEMWQTIKSGRVWRSEICNRRKDGSLFWLDSTIVPVLDENNIPIQFVAIRTDITQLKETQEKLRKLSYYDSLTDLPNRRLFHETLTTYLENIDYEKNRLVALFYMDLDRFKSVNDSLGHDVGDLLLQQVAERMQLHIPENALLARLGGDEFAVIFNYVLSIEVLINVANNIIKSMNTVFYIRHHEIYIGTSIGISLSTDSTKIDTLIKYADIALYRAKDLGKNNAQFFNTEMSDQAVARLHMENNLRLAVKRGEFYLEYLPVLNLKTGRITSAEALLRWKNQELGQVSPAVFLPIAEEIGLMRDIGNWVLRTVCSQLKQWHQQKKFDIHVSLNLSFNQFCSMNLEHDMNTIIQEIGIKPNWIELELTELMLMLPNGNEEIPSESVFKMIENLKRLGIKLSIDDFGTGYSSLSKLKMFPIDSLKIDSSFVNTLPDVEDDVLIVEAMIKLGKSIGLTIVAEGVENEKQFSILHQLGCDAIQGRYYSDSLIASDFEKLLLNWNPHTDYEAGKIKHLPKNKNIFNQIEV